MWDAAVLVFATYNAFFMPLNYAFKIADGNNGLIFLDNLIDFIFLFDIIWNFFTSYLTSTGVEIFDSIEIAKHYVNTIRFATDFLSILGMGIFESISSKLDVFGIFKIVRILRLNTVIRDLPIAGETKSVFNFIKLTFFMVIWLHCVGCFMWVFVETNADVVKIRPTDGEEIAMMWYPPLDWINYTDIKIYNETVL